jgi:hypothetical protein
MTTCTPFCSRCCFGMSPFLLFWSKCVCFFDLPILEGDGDVYFVEVEERAL